MGNINTNTLCACLVDSNNELTLGQLNNKNQKQKQKQNQMKSKMQNLQI